MADDDDNQLRTERDEPVFSRGSAAALLGRGSLHVMDAGRSVTADGTLNPMTAGDHLASLVRSALDEFDDREVVVSVRRAYRIARQRGDVETAHRLLFELRPIGGSDDDRMRALRALYPDEPYEQIRERHRVFTETFLVARTPRGIETKDDDSKSVLGGSVAELEESLRRSESGAAKLEAVGEWHAFGQLAETAGWFREVLERIRFYVYDYLAGVEAQLAVSDTVSATFERHRADVDRLLDQVAPEVRDKLQAALRTARQDGGEARAQVMLTCRRLIIAIADHLYPASAQPYMDSKGKEWQVGPGHYRNRVRARLDSGTASKTVAATVDELIARLDRLDELAQKGVHSEISDDDMRFALAQTYLLAGELLRRSTAS